MSAVGHWSRRETSRSTVIDEQLADAAAERATLVADLPADLLALYDRLREQKDGVGAAELRQRQCAGCRLSRGQSRIGEDQDVAQRRGSAL